MASLCEQTRAWLHDQSHTPITPPPDDLCEHIAGCASCRGALLILMAELLGTPLSIDDITCDKCQEQLAAYIDEELDHGMRAAATAFPEVWWHLWTCAECAETYRVTLAVLGSPEPAPAPAPEPQRRSLGLFPNKQRFDLPRAFLNRVIQVPLRLGVAWGEEENDIPVFDETLDEYELQLNVQRQPDGSWHVHIKITPPILGQSILMLGTETFRASFAPDGRALMTAIPDLLLRDSDGPDMTLLIEPM